jgi:hypothetical protein
MGTGVLLSGLLSPAAHAQLSPARPATVQRPIPVLQPPPGNFEYPQHQTLTYSVDWRVFTAGTTVFHLDRAGDDLKIAATADSTGAVNLLFPVADRFQSGFTLRWRTSATW